MKPEKKRFYKKVVITAVVAVPLLWFILAPFPGMAMIYSITDPLRGHPHRPHGNQPGEFVGMWMQEEPEEYGFRATAFILLGDSNVANGGGMSSLRWHVEGDTFFGDYMSRCGNCYAGNLTGKYEYEFDGPDRLKLTHVDETFNLKYSGWYRRTEITEELVTELEELEKLGREAKSSQALWALLAIESARHRGVDVPETSFRRD